MKLARFGYSAAVAATLATVFAGCSSDTDADKPQSSATGGSSSGDGGGSGDTGGSNSGTGSNSNGTGATQNMGGGGGEPNVVSCDVYGAREKTETLEGEITSDITLKSDTLYKLDGMVFVNDGATVTVEPCTRIEGMVGADIAALIVRRGAKLVAEGEADAPVVFTSEKPVGSRLPGDWGGVVMLGKAKNNTEVADALFEGTADTRFAYGGENDADSSGSLKYVRIEFAGFEFVPGKELNGLSMASVGSGTTLSHIMVSNGRDDCFEWFGGTVDADHLVCNNADDDMFDTSEGFRGTLDTIFGRQVFPGSDDPQGIESDSRGAAWGTAPFATDVEYKNVTLCGEAGNSTKVRVGMMLRRATTGSLDNAVVVGFNTGANLKDEAWGTDPHPVTIANSFFFENLDAGAVDTVAITSGGVNGFDATAAEEWFTDVASNKTTTPGFDAADCQGAGSTEEGPQDAVLDSDKGAFKGGADWLQGKWIDWATM